jgi:hypothetical protein
LRFPDQFGTIPDPGRPRQKLFKKVGKSKPDAAGPEIIFLGQFRARLSIISSYVT